MLLRTLTLAASRKSVSISWSETPIVFRNSALLTTDILRCLVCEQNTPGNDVVVDFGKP